MVQTICLQLLVCLLFYLSQRYHWVCPIGRNQIQRAYNNWINKIGTHSHNRILLFQHTGLGLLDLSSKNRAFRLRYWTQYISHGSGQYAESLAWSSSSILFLFFPSKNWSTILSKISAYQPRSSTQNLIHFFPFAEFHK